ncbi:MAG: hypothetical protein P8X95_13255 [Anaerolineales bacterium]
MRTRRLKRRAFIGSTPSRAYCTVADQTLYCRQSEGVAPVLDSDSVLGHSPIGQVQFAGRASAVGLGRRRGQMGR